MPTINLRSADGELFPVDLEVAKKSMTIKTMLDTLEIGEDDDEEVPILNVNAAILKLVIQWATYHKDDPQPNDDENTKTAEKINKIIMILICILLAFFNHAFLIFNLEEINETAITTAQKLIDATDSGVLQFLEEHKILKSDVIQFVKIDLG